MPIACEQLMQLSRDLQICGTKLNKIITSYSHVYSQKGSIVSLTKERCLPCSNLELISQNMKVIQEKFITSYLGLHVL